MPNMDTHSVNVIRIGKKAKQRINGVSCSKGI